MQAGIIAIDGPPTLLAVHRSHGPAIVVRRAVVAISVGSLHQHMTDAPAVALQEALDQPGRAGA